MMGIKIILSFAFFTMLLLICINEKNSVSALAVQPIFSTVKTNAELGVVSAVGTVVSTAGYTLSGLKDNIKTGGYVSDPNANHESKRSPFELPLHSNLEVEGPQPVPSLGRQRRASIHRQTQQRRKTMEQLQQLATQQNAQQCLQKVICELSADRNAYGREGLRFGRNLLLLEGTVDARTARFYRQAASTGNAIKNAKLCVNHYPNCVHPSPQLIMMANRIMSG